MVWTLFVLVAGVAFWLLLRGVIPQSRHRSSAVALGLGLWMMVPVFLVSSVQVRTDQPATLFGLLGGVALLASRKTVPWSLAAGVLFGVGFLFSQKAAYVIGLTGILAVGELVLRRRWTLRRESTRLALFTAFLLVLFGYRAIVQASGGSARLMPGSGQFDTVAFYREMVGWREYRRMLPQLVPQLLAVVSLLGVTVSWFGGRRGHGRELAVGWAVLGFGVLVLLFHAGRFSYFHMTVG